MDWNFRCLWLVKFDRLLCRFKYDRQNRDCFLGVMNCYALSLMWTKYQDLKRAIRNNERDEKRINRSFFHI